MKLTFVSTIATMLLLQTFAETCPDQCLSYFDGCNTCDCTKSNNPHCTKRTCGKDSQRTPTCKKCESNLQWNECGSICVKTCSDPSPICISECYPRCECPTDKPILSNGVCIAYDDCLQIEPASVCPDDCAVYFNGCNYCECNSDGSMSCTTNVCSTYSDPYCSTCKNNLEWTSCGSSCTKTCTDLNPVCSDKTCIERCQCPSNKPIYRDGVCLSLDECFNFKNVCPSNCSTYYDGCDDCLCLDGEDACTNRICNTVGIAKCTNCTSNLEWTGCGPSCFKTCSNPNPSCSSSCVATCTCPDSKPILKDGVCIAYSECNCNCASIPLPNGEYVASRTEKCNSYTTEDSCKKVDFCLWKCQ